MIQNKFYIFIPNMIVQYHHLLFLLLFGLTVNITLFIIYIIIKKFRITKQEKECSSIQKTLIMTIKTQLSVEVQLEQSPLYKVLYSISK